MRKAIIFIWMFITSIGWMAAQAPKHDKDKIKEIKEAYFVQYLKLTKSEADKFLTLYQKYDVERRNLRKSGKKPGQKMKFSEMSDQEINDFIQSNFALKEQELQLQKKYFEEFKKVLPPQKLVKVLNIEEQFRQYLFKQAQEKK